jgi:hypothetical protein
MAMLTGRRRAQWETIVWLSPNLKKGVHPSDANPYRKRGLSRGGGPRMTERELDAWANELSEANK